MSHWQRAHRERTATYDVVVVGGGFVGCSTAYWLRQHQPGLEVAIVDADTLGSGASGKNAGFVLQGTDADFLTDIDRYGARTARRLWAFTLDNRDLLASELQSTAFNWQSPGSITVATSDEANRCLQRCVPHLRAAGAQVVHLGAEKTNARLQSAGYTGSLFVTTGATVDPLRLVRHVATDSGADVWTQHPVEALQPRGDGIAVETRPRRLWAGQVVLAVGPALPSLVPSASKVVRPVRAQMLATAPAEERALTHPVYTHDGGYYVRQVEGGSVLAGGGRHEHRGAEETDADATTPAVQAAIERHLHHHFPWAQSLSVRQRWSGTMAFSPDGRPVVGPVPELPGSFFATGFTGHGMGYGFRMGRLLADLVCGTVRPDGLDLFSVSRFDGESFPHRTSSQSRPQQSPRSQSSPSS